MTHEIRIGTSGWNYDHWKGRFYPQELPKRGWFSYYCEAFETVEINNTFYKQPSKVTFDKWRRQAPKGFIYAIKASRYLTHMRKLNEPKQPLKRFLDGARRLKHALDPTLYQLPPHWKKNLQRLRTFAEALPTDLIHLLEFHERD